MPKQITKYGLSGGSPLQIEMEAIRRGGHWTSKTTGTECGEGLFHHYREMQRILWPDEDHHRWTDLILKTVLENRITVIAGPRDSGKTSGISKYALCDYWCFPETTLFLISSTDLRGLELRVWGSLKDLFDRARERFPFLQGQPLEGKHGIFTDKIDDDTDVRDLRKGIICFPTLGSNNQWVGLTRYTGIKQKRRRLIGDEVQFYQLPYLTTLANLDKGDFKGCFLGNPIGEGDPLDQLSEPVDGWDSVGEVTSTATWKNKFGGITINLVGLDSPNFDYPQDQPAKFPYLIEKRDIDRVAEQFGKDSSEYWSQVVGVRKAGLTARRVLTRALCRKNGAQDDPKWAGMDRTKIYAVDAAYGGDRCVGGYIEFGKEMGGKMILQFHPPVIIPVSVKTDQVGEAEYQIAEFVKRECESLEIPPRNMFHDATGRGSLGTALARVWSAETNPVEFGGTATKRPVSQDIYVDDETTHLRRLKRCDEHYSKFVTELWFSVRYAVESSQIRSLPQEVMDEFCAREWRTVRGDRKELETKEEMKERVGRSPDLADHASICVEGARRLGFLISKLAQPEPGDVATDEDYFEMEAAEQKRIFGNHSLVHA